MNLCTFSTSEILVADILPECPLALTKSESTKCPCRKREYHVPPADLRVLSCTFPKSFNGQPVHNPDALVASIRAKRERESQERKQQRQTEKRERSPSVAKEKVPDKKPEQTPNLPAMRNSGGRSIMLAWPEQRVREYAAIGRIIYQSGMLGCQDDKQGFMLAVYCRGDLAKLQKIGQTQHLVKGRLTMKADAMLSAFMQVGGKRKVLSRTKDRAEIELSIDGDTQRFAFTIEEAAVEDYVYTTEANDGKVKKLNADGTINNYACKTNWSTPRRRMQMLWARVISDGVGVMKPEVKCGRYTPDEFGGDDVEAVAEDMIDVEFEVVGGEQEEPADKPAATAVATEAEQTPFTPTAETAEAARVMHVEQDKMQHAEERRAILEELVAIKKALYVGDDAAAKWGQVLAKRGVKSAKELEVAPMRELLAALRGVAAKRHAAAAEAKDAGGTDALSRWANRLPPLPDGEKAAAEAALGN